MCMANDSKLRHADRDKRRRKRTRSKGDTLIHTLPDEILFEIFLLLVQATGSLWYPWVLGIVCKRWREHTLSHPRLWTYITFMYHDCFSDGHSILVDAGPSDDKYDEEDVLRTYLQIERSKNSPLFIDADRFCFECPSQISKFRLLLAHSRRWEEVSFVCVGKGHSRMESMLRELIVPEQPRFPDLRKIRWLSHPSANTLPLNELLPAAESGDELTTNLRSLHLLYFGGVVQDAPFPWSQLTSLSLESYSGTVSALLTLLSDAESLTHLTISVYHRPEPNPPPPSTSIENKKPIVFLPNLLSLDMADTTPDSLIHLITNISVPSLIELTCKSFSENKHVEAIVDLIKRSSCSLIALTWRNFRTSNCDFLPLLRRCPDLEVFSHSGPMHPSAISSQLGRPSIVQNLTQGSSNVVVPRPADESHVTGDDSGSATGESVCPRLKSLTLGQLRVDPVFLIEMLESRLVGTSSTTPTNSGSRGGCLKSVQITWPRSPQSVDSGPHAHKDDRAMHKYCKKLVKARLREYIEGGLQVKVILSPY